MTTTRRTPKWTFKNKDLYLAIFAVLSILVTFFADSQGHKLVSGLFLLAALMVLLWLLGGEAKQRGHKKSALLILIGSFVIPIAFGGYLIYESQFKEDVLYPGNEPTPAHTEETIKGGVDLNKPHVYAAGSTYGLQGTNMFHLLIYNSTPLITMRVTSDGILFSGDFYGPKGDIVASLKDNRMHLSKTEVFRIEKDRHSIAIWDNQNRKVLDIRYLNKNAIKFNARMFLPGSSIEINDDNWIKLGPGRSKLVMSANTSEGANAFIALDGPPLN